MVFIMITFQYCFTTVVGFSLNYLIYTPLSADL